MTFSAGGVCPKAPQAASSAVPKPTVFQPQTCASSSLRFLLLSIIAICHRALLSSLAITSSSINLLQVTCANTSVRLVFRSIGWVLAPVKYAADAADAHWVAGFEAG